MLVFNIILAAPPTLTTIRNLVTYENTKDTFVYFSERRKQRKVAASVVVV
jgi:hypothetical protein